MKTRFVLLGIILFAGALWSGCDSFCNAVYYFSGAFLTVHLPPASGVAAPEAVVVCRESTCATATLPVDPSAAFEFSLPEVTATISLDAGDVRLLRILWTVNDVPTSDRQETYDVTVTDAAGTVTGRLNGTVAYSGSMPNGPGCGLTLYGALSD